jgi:tetratricopeptide (TPR) repeat protein
MEHAIRLERAGNVEQAIDVLALAIQQVKQPAPLYNKLALILAHQLREFPRAISLMELALMSAPTNTVYEQNLQMIRSMQASHREQVVQQRKRVWSSLVKGPGG